MIELISPKNSLGITRYCQTFELIFNSRGINVKFLQKPSSSHSFAHFHIGNSGREVLMSALEHKTRAIATMHDVVPRNPILRFFIGRLQLFLLRNHQLVVHSEYAKALARKKGYAKSIEVVPMGPLPLYHDPIKVENNIPLNIKPNSEIGEDGNRITLRICQPGVAKKAKALPELIIAASKFPQITLVIAGEIKDQTTQDLIRKYKELKLIQLGYCSDEVLNQEIQKSDYVTCFRTSSVGETNAPLVLSHYLGTPVTGWSVGSIPEYSLPGDQIFPEGTSIEEILKILLRKDSALQAKPTLLRDRVLKYWDITFEKYKEIYSRLGWL
ncbi:glycosyltransferase [Leptospira andrefontaineae]|uniref:Glycosyltransferase family 1 protein n=1 Tax=Leptospira andrefontaineae TaxID=2484976 RepID=A0A4R9HCK4_9LEPT|nr:glycosyltransferase [Leptospira andrefontaineae]TGK44559.1 glycosyltransferase family 1 protein [Leptospira andrefontaineae]